MTEGTKISWASDTWNPLRAIAGGKSGWMCVPVDEGCQHCYAQDINMSRVGNGLPYSVASLEKVQFRLSDVNSNTGIEWPLKTRKSLHRKIFLASMTDWMGNFYNKEWQSLLLAVMSLSSWNMFMTLTKRRRNMFNMLLTINDVADRTILLTPSKAVSDALMHVNINKRKFAFKNTGSLKLHAAGQAITPWRTIAEVPWPPRNIVFGVSVSTVKAAEETVELVKKVRAVFGYDLLIAISQEPALDMIDWGKLGLREKDVNQIIWGGESGPEAREFHPDSWEALREYGKKSNTPVYWKQSGSLFAKANKLANLRGEDPEEQAVIGRFNPIRQEIDMTGRLI